MSNIGWIKLNRRILDSWLWEDKPFDKAHAWIDLLLLANHKENKMLFNGEVVTVDRGSLITSTVKLAQRWGWNRRTVSRFLNVLENDEMIEQKRSHMCTTIKILNYSIYQDFSVEDSEQVHNPIHNSVHNGVHNRVHTNKNVKNDKNVKKSAPASNKFGQFPQNTYDFEEIERTLLSN